MGQKPKDRSARVKSMDALLAQSKRESDRPHIGKVKFEVRERGEISSANEDPRGWLFSGRPPAPGDDDNTSDDLHNAKFLVQSETTSDTTEDPRGWLFSGRPDAPERMSDALTLENNAKAETLDPAVAPAQPPPPQAATKEAKTTRTPGVPAPVAKLDLVKKRKRRRSSGEREAVRDDAPPRIEPSSTTAKSEASQEAATEATGPRAEEQPLQTRSGPEPPVSQVERDVSNTSKDKPSEDGPSTANQEDSDPTLRVATPSTDNNELEALSSAISAQLEVAAPQKQRSPKKAGRTALLVSGLFLLGALMASYYLYNRGVLDVFADPGTGRTSRKIVAYRVPMKTPKVVVAAKVAQNAATSPAGTEPTPPKPETPLEEAELPPKEIVTEIDEMTPEQQAMPEEARVKDARYLRSRGFRAIRQEKLDKAEESFRQSLQLYPDSSVSLRGLGETLLLKGEQARARAWLGRALRRNPADKEAQALLDKLEED